MLPIIDLPPTTHDPMLTRKTLLPVNRGNVLKPQGPYRKRAGSDYSRETERKVERLLGELYEALNIQRPEDLYGSIVIEARYQKGRPVGQVDVNIKYVLKRAKDDPIDPGYDNNHR